jgi:NAD(P)-dependent dehydrogenase (short-subunit alcohol dehydrogenase family)
VKVLCVAGDTELVQARLMPGLVVLGARSLGGAILDRYVADGWQTAAIAQSEETLGMVRDRGALALQADALDPEQLAAALAQAREQLGSVDLVVNALSVAAPVAGEPWGGGPVADATLDGWERWTAAISRMAFVFLSEGARALRAGGNGGTLIQISNGSAVRPARGAALVAGGHHSLRALTHAAAQDLRAEGIRVCLLIVDAPIWSPKSAEGIVANGLSQEQVADQDEIAKAVRFLESQGPGGTVYDLTIRPSGLPWAPAS